MTRVNHPDSLLTELRDIKRRLRALETSLGTRPPAEKGTAPADADRPPPPADTDRAEQAEPAGVAPAESADAG